MVESRCPPLSYFSFVSGLLFVPVETMSDEQVFRVYLGNIPVDVLLEEVWINGKQLMSESAEWDSSVSPVVHINGSRGYELQLPFEDTIVHWMVRVPPRTCITSLTC